MKFKYNLNNRTISKVTILLLTAAIIITALFLSAININGISGTTVYNWNRIEIGDNTLIGANGKILDSDFHPLTVEEWNSNNWVAVVKTATAKMISKDLKEYKVWA